MFFLTLCFFVEFLNKFFLCKKEKKARLQSTCVWWVKPERIAKMSKSRLVSILSKSKN